MKILGIETSCDETALSIVEAEGGLEHPRFKLVGSALFSQVEIHKEYGGVFPNLAKREHAKNVIPLFEKMLRETGMLFSLSTHRSETRGGSARAEKSIPVSLENQIREILKRENNLAEEFIAFFSKIEKPPIDAIAVTEGPGLEPALWVGISFARALALLWNLPLIPTNHMEGHIVSPLLDQKDLIEFPLLALLISGGHTELVYSEKWGQYKKIGETKDDAVGEAFDKVARMMGLPYPGGPEISKLATEARLKKIETSTVPTLPRPMIKSGDFHFSFSGLKTAVLYLIKKLGTLSLDQKKEIAREFEDAVIDVLISKTKKALEEHTAKTLLIGGGVIANKAIRGTLENLKNEFPDLNILLPSQDLSTDNAIMIAMAAYIQFSLNPNEFKPEQSIKAQGNLSLEKTA